MTVHDDMEPITTRKTSSHIFMHARFSSAMLTFSWNDPMKCGPLSGPACNCVCVCVRSPSSTRVMWSWVWRHRWSQWREE